MFSSFVGAVEAAISITVCNMSVIIPAALRALNVGDPFMREDTTDMDLSTLEIARTTSTRIELNLPRTQGRVRAMGDGEPDSGTIGTVALRQLDSVGLDVKDDQKHRLTTQTSDGSLGTTSTKAVLLAHNSNIVEKDRDIEADVEKGATSNET